MVDYQFHKDSDTPLLGDPFTLMQTCLQLTRQEDNQIYFAFRKRKLLEVLYQRYEFITVQETKEILVLDYNDGYYSDNGEDIILTEISRAAEVRDFPQESIGKGSISWIIDEIKNRSKKSNDSFEENKTSMWINVKNCWLNIQTREFYPHYLTPELIQANNPDLSPVDKDLKFQEYQIFIKTHRFRTQIPIDYDPIKTCPKFLLFLSQVLPEQQGNNNNMLTMLEELGYGLYPQMPIQQALVMVGDGSNGKSLCQAIFRTFYGKGNVTGVQIHELTKNRYRPAELYMKKMNIQSDVSASVLKNVQMFQRLVGGDSITAERKNKDPFDFVNTAKVMLSCNRPPKLEDYDRTNAFFRRWVIVQFLRRFTGENCRKFDELLEECTSDDELSGMLNVALEGLNRLITQQHFSNNPTIEDVERQWIRLSDPAEWFAREIVDKDNENGMHIDTKLLHGFFHEICEKQGLSKQGLTYFSRCLNQFSDIKSKQTTFQGEKIRKYQNISFNDGYDQVFHEYCERNEQTPPEPEHPPTEAQHDDNIGIRQFFGQTPNLQDSIIEAIRRYRDEDGFVKPEAIFNYLSNTEYTEEQIQEVIDKLSQDGTIYEPRPNRIGITHD